MFVLRNRSISGYKFGQKTWYGAKHLGVDYAANGDPVFAPKNGTILKSFWGTEGGNTIWFQPDGEDVMIRLMHLKSFVVRSGHVNEGQQIAVSGNTGAFTTGPHLHVDITRYWGGSFWTNFNNFIDPETYNWGSAPKPPAPAPNNEYPKRVTVVVNKVYIRTAPNTGAALGGDKYLLLGTTITVNNVVTGQNVSGNDKWYVSVKGNYIWTGAFS